MPDNLTTGEDLAPCPFCGTALKWLPESKAWEHDHTEGEGCIIETAVYLQDDDDVAAWNTRHTQAESAKRIAELEECLRQVASRSHATLNKDQSDG